MPFKQVRKKFRSHAKLIEAINAPPPPLRIHSKNERFLGDLKQVFQLVPHREPVLGL